jgi:homoserine O-acetyltransferase
MTIKDLRRFVQRDVRLASGASLPEVVTAYATRGVLAPDGRNCVLVTHGYTGGPDMIFDGTEAVDGSWAALVGPGCAIDTDRFFVVCPNALGSSFGSTNASSIEPASGRAYGSRFPDVSISDIVAGQHALLRSLGVEHLIAVAGPSFGGLQVFQWGVQFPDFMSGLVAVITAPKMPNVDVESLAEQLETLPGWNGGDYDVSADLTHALAVRRLQGLRAFGAAEALAARFPDETMRDAELWRLAKAWAEQFDANSMLILFKAMAAFDVTPQLDRIRVPLLYVLSRSDRLIAASSAQSTMAEFRHAGIDARYVEIDSEHGHSASGSDAHLWSATLRDFLNEAAEGQRRIAMADSASRTHISGDANLATEQVPVLISGAGPVGLMMSILLSRQGIRNVLVEKRAGIGTLPRARGITARTVELFTQLGLADQVDQISLPPLWTAKFVYAETLAGELVGVMPSNTMAPGASAAYTPCDYKVAAQDRIDPMLFDCASRFDDADIRFSTELLGFTEDADGVWATVRGADGRQSRIRSSFIVAADGGKSLLRGLAGIGERGRTNLRSFVNNHIKADLSRFTKGREGPLIWTLAAGREGVFQMLDGDKNWAVQIQFDPEIDRPESWTEERVIATLREMIGSPDGDDVELEIIKTYTYTLSAMVSERLRQGRLLLVGDAAHQVPPYGGFGLNTGIQTAHNLAWKLGAVIRGEASSDLLDTFDTERREVADRVCAFGRVNAAYVEQLMAAVRAAATHEARSRIVSGTRQYGNWLGLDIGVHYEGAGAFVADDVALPAVADPVVDFVPHAKPGHRAPHLWVRRGAERMSTIMLFDNAFVLLAGPDGTPWVEAARRVSAQRAPSIVCYRVSEDGDLRPEQDFCRLYGISPSGAVLVRPDGHVALRVQSLPADPAATLQIAMDVILRR